jgi:hypothetical protein
MLVPTPPVPPLPALSAADRAEECSQLKDAYRTCKSLGVPTLPIYMELHRVQDGY